MSLSNGIFCISLDFEKFWGLHDVADPDEVSVNLMKVSDIIKRKLEIFENKGIHATWATVGLLLDENPIKTYSYKGKINYEIAEYSPYPLAEKYKKVEPSILSGVDEVKQILNTEHQELASHSFSHLYAIEKGIDRPAFIEDIDDMIYALSKFNSQATSIVFPRNQVNEEWLELLNSAGYKAFRGNQQNSLWSNESYSKESLVKRGRRWSDAYFGKSKTQFSRLKD
ncbi:MAG: polysaccharide deacetylase family protein, partial [Crocinitomicaceae bacterium]|nr:polysaccharide deacetylase family protein [Crocinitomicaceae bacterium]